MEEPPRGVKNSLEEVSVDNVRERVGCRIADVRVRPERRDGAGEPSDSGNKSGRRDSRLRRTDSSRAEYVPSPPYPLSLVEPTDESVLRPNNVPVVGDVNVSPYDVAAICVLDRLVADGAPSDVKE